MVLTKGGAIEMYFDHDEIAQYPNITGLTYLHNALAVECALSDMNWDRGIASHILFANGLSTTMPSGPTPTEDEVVDFIYDAEKTMHDCGDDESYCKVVKSGCRNPITTDHRAIKLFYL